MKDGEADYSKYTAEQVDRSLRTIDREKYPLNYANLLAAQRAFPALPMDEGSVAAREDAALLESVVSGKVWISAPFLLTFWVPCLSRVVVRGDSLEVRSLFQRDLVPLTDVALVRWLAANSGDWHLAVIELRRGSHINLMPRSRSIMRAFAAHVSAVQGGIDVADPEYQSTFFIGGGNP